MCTGNGREGKDGLESKLDSNVCGENFVVCGLEIILALDS